MRGVILLGMLCCLWGWANAQADYVLTPVRAQPVPVSLYHVTTLIFPAAVRSGVRVSRDVEVEKVLGVENVLAIRAVRGRITATNLAVFSMDGRTYSFDLTYSDTAGAWQYRVVSTGALGRGLILTGLPADEGILGDDARLAKSKRGWMRAASIVKKIRVTIKGVYVADSLIWLVGSIRNRSTPDFVVERVRLFTEDRKRIKRMAVQEADLEPVYSEEPGQVSGGSVGRFALGYRGLMSPAGKRLVLEVSERDGGRVMRVRIPVKKILAARQLRNKNE